MQELRSAERVRPEAPPTKDLFPDPGVTYEAGAPSWLAGSNNSGASASAIVNAASGSASSSNSPSSGSGGGGGNTALVIALSVIAVVAVLGFIGALLAFVLFRRRQQPKERKRLWRLSSLSDSLPEHSNLRGTPRSRTSRANSRSTKSSTASWVSKHSKRYRPAGAVDLERTSSSHGGRYAQLSRSAKAPPAERLGTMASSEWTSTYTSGSAMPHTEHDVGLEPVRGGADQPAHCDEGISSGRATQASSLQTLRAPNAAQGAHHLPRALSAGGHSDAPASAAALHYQRTSSSPGQLASTESRRQQQQLPQRQSMRLASTGTQLASCAEAEFTSATTSSLAASAPAASVLAPNAASTQSGSATTLEVALTDAVAARPPKPFQGRFILLHKRVSGGQALVQFARDANGAFSQYAIKYAL